MTALLQDCERSQAEQKSLCAACTDSRKCGPALREERKKELSRNKWVKMEKGLSSVHPIAWNSRSRYQSPSVWTGMKWTEGRETAEQSPGGTVVLMTVQMSGNEMMWNNLGYQKEDMSQLKTTLKKCVHLCSSRIHWTMSFRLSVYYLLIYWKSVTSGLLISLLKSFSRT